MKKAFSEYPNNHSPKPTSGLRWLKNRSVLLLVSTLLFCGIGFLLLKDRKLRKEDQSYITKDDLRHMTDSLNKKLTYLSITDADNVLALLNSDGSGRDRPLVQYLVSVQDKYVGQIAIFKSTKYVMSSDPLKLDPTVRGLCETIDKTLEEQDEILKTLQNAQIKFNLSISFWGVADAGIELSPPKAMLVELASILRAFSGVKAKKIEILIKGYADGHRYAWTAPLLPPPYDYKVVNVYPRAEQNRIDSFQFIRVEKTKHIDENYSNEHLPELRARFVQENFISKFLDGCSSTTKPDVHILEGYADDSTAINEPDRKVQIFINVY